MDSNFETNPLPDGIINQMLRFKIIPLICVLISAGNFGTGTQPHQAPSKASTLSAFLNQSRTIFVGKVLDKKSIYSKELNHILTQYTFRVRQRIKGSLPDYVEITEYGGTVGDQIEWFSHNANYSVGGSYLVFCHRDPFHLNRTLGGWQGAFQIFGDRRGTASIRLPVGHPLSEMLRTKGTKTFHSLTNSLEALIAHLEGE